MQKSILLAGCLAATIVLSPGLRADDAYPNPMSLPEVKSFLGAGGLGSAHPEAPAELAQFGRLVGIWQAEVEMRSMSGAWVRQKPGIWIWKYALGGFATQDLWLHTQEHLPAYLSTLGRAYQLTALRIFDVRAGHWQIAWAANGGGKSPGSDFGTFTASEKEGAIVLEEESSFGKQRVTFSDITESSFKWTSEFSQDGESWNTVMRVTAHRKR